MSLLSRAFDPNDPSVHLHDVLGVGALVSHVAMQAHVTIATHAFDPNGFGVGTAAIIAAMVGGGWLKGRQSPASPGGTS